MAAPYNRRVASFMASVSIVAAYRFVDLPETVIAAVRAKGWRFYNFVGATGVRFMCSWDTTARSVDALLADMRSAF